MVIIRRDKLYVQLGFWQVPTDRILQTDEEIAMFSDGRDKMVLDLAPTEAQAESLLHALGLALQENRSLFDIGQWYRDRAKGLRAVETIQ